MTEKKIMIVGQGLLGTLALDMFLRYPHKHEVLVTGRDLETIRTRANLSLLVATQLGFHPGKVDAAYMDVHNIEQTAETIAKYKPDIILSAVAMQSWIRITGSFPKPIVEQITKARRGSWLPMSLTLIYKLMQAVKQSGCKPIVINASYPDVINPMLHGAGLGPHIGIGNVGNSIPGLRNAAAYALNLPLERVDVRLFAMHAWTHKIDRSGDTGGAPFHLTILVDGEDWTKKVDLNTVFNLMITKFKRPVGFDRMPISASASVNVLEAFANDRNKVVHAPGPNGLPGGYPVRVNKGQISVELPAGLTLEEAIRINEQCQRFDGIDFIDKEGTVHFTDEEVDIMKNTFGFEKKKIAVAETEDCANELFRCWENFVSKIPQPA